LWDNPAQTPEETKENEEMIDTATAEFTERCDTAPWSDASRGCILAAESIKEVSACGAL
jgi:hypothetical protein